jgi:glyoxylase-like metal-dependent hydrolase (beta-lactamase superfamily II)
MMYECRMNKNTVDPARTIISIRVNRKVLALAVFVLSIAVPFLICLGIPSVGRGQSATGYAIDRLAFQGVDNATDYFVFSSEKEVYSINPVDQISQQQFAFAQENTNVSSSTNTTFPRIHNYTSSPPGPVNSWFFESANGLVVIDTQRTLSEAENALDEIKKINKPILGVIITHPHPDHIGGTEVLLNGTSSVPIYSTQLTFDIMKNDTGGLIALTKQLHGDDYADQVVLPNKILTSDEIITIDGITYSFEDIGPGEAGDMMLIYLPKQKLLFTGDVVNNRMHPALIEGRSSDWIKQLEYIGQNYSDARVLFPGHGQSGSPKALLDGQLEYINTFRSLVEQQLQLTGNITEEGKTKIKSELQKLYPNYLHVASLPLSDMLDLNIDAIAKEISQTR